MTFTNWLYLQAEALGVTRLEISKETGVPYRTLSQSNKCKPHMDNMIIICEYINKLQEGDQDNLNALICSAISACCIHYQYAVDRIEKRSKNDKSR